MKQKVADEYESNLRGLGAFLVITVVKRAIFEIRLLIGRALLRAADILGPSVDDPDEDRIAEVRFTMEPLTEDAQMELLSEFEMVFARYKAEFMDATLPVAKDDHDE